MQLVASREQAASFIVLLQESSLEFICYYHHPADATLAAGGWKAKV
jgi:hypothetical protein